MYLFVVLLLTPWTVGGQPVSFTINRIELQALPSATLQNGDNLRLKCVVNIARSSNFQPNSTFQFFKDDILIKTITTTTFQAVHTITNASVSRSGFYKCRISAESKQKTSEEIQVKVTGLSAPMISISPKEVSEGDEITITCKAPTEEPPMTFTFYKSEGKPLKEKISPNKREMQTTYQIKEGERILHFFCSVKLMILGEPESPPSASETVTVTDLFSTPKIEVSPSNNFTEGRVLQVMCSVQKSYINSKEVTITLQKGNHILNASITGMLTYSRVATVSDMGNYTCKAEGKTASKTTSTMIHVQELFPKPLLKLSKRSKYINEGDVATLECSVSSLSPQEAALQDFYFKVQNKEMKYRKKGGKLLMRFKATDSGDYKCEVTIANITKTSDLVQVKVYAAVAKPEIKQIIKGNKMVVLGDTLTLTCRSPTGTPPITYKLYREEEELGRKEMNDSREAVFKVNTTKRHDLGQYKCHASNRNNQSDAFSDVLNVTVIAPVRRVSLVIIPENGEVDDGAELSMVCKAENGTLPITFSFYAKKGKESLLYNVTETDKKHAQHIVTSFTKQRDGTYYCAASNQANKSVESQHMEVKAVLPKWKKAIIIIFVLFIIVVAIAIGLYLYWDRKKKVQKISSDSSRSSKAINSSEKPAVDLKTDDSYFGSVQNEEELHILKTAEENTGNSQQNHDIEYTDADGSAPDPNHDSVESNVSENPNVNNLT